MKEEKRLKSWPTDRGQSAKGGDDWKMHTRRLCVLFAVVACIWRLNRH